MVPEEVHVKLFKSWQRKRTRSRKIVSRGRGHLLKIKTVLIHLFSEHNGIWAFSPLTWRKIIPLQRTAWQAERTCTAADVLKFDCSTFKEFPNQINTVSLSSVLICCLETKQDKGKSVFSYHPYHLGKAMLFCPCPTLCSRQKSRSTH